MEGSISTHGWRPSRQYNRLPSQSLVLAIPSSTVSPPSLHWSRELLDFIAIWIRAFSWKFSSKRGCVGSPRGSTRRASEDGESHAGRWGVVADERRGALDSRQRDREGRFSDKTTRCCLSSRLPSMISHEQLQFCAENETITIIPSFSRERLQLVNVSAFALLPRPAIRP